jgi:hypothetical protein
MFLFYFVHTASTSYCIIFQFVTKKYLIWGGESDSVQFYSA